MERNYLNQEEFEVGETIGIYTYIHAKGYSDKLGEFIRLKGCSILWGVKDGWPTTDTGLRVHENQLELKLKKMAA